MTMTIMKYMLKIMNLFYEDDNCDSPRLLVRCGLLRAMPERKCSFSSMSSFALNSSEIF